MGNYSHNIIHFSSSINEVTNIIAAEMKLIFSLSIVLSPPMHNTSIPSNIYNKQF
jgi:hypothetical protein